MHGLKQGFIKLLISQDYLGSFSRGEIKREEKEGKGKQKRGKGQSAEKVRKKTKWRQTKGNGKQKKIILWLRF